MSVNLNLTENLPLFSQVSIRTCERCFDTGIWLTPENLVKPCPKIQLGEVHVIPNDAALRVQRSAYRLNELEIWINFQALDLARLLTNFTSGEPCPRQEIFDTFYGDTNLSFSYQLRKFHAIVEELRRIWLLPVGSRKDAPSGYWIITELSDYKVWFDRAKSAPITQLSTIHKNAKFNFPVFAEQMELEFWNDFNKV